MKRTPPSLQYVVVCSTRATAMSTRPPFRGGSYRGYPNRPFSGGGGGRGYYVTGDSHNRSVQDANLGFRQSDAANQTGHHHHRPPPQFNQHNHFSRVPPPSDYNHPYRPRQRFAPPQQFRPPQQRPQKPSDHRNWEYAKATVPPNSERFTVLSYNILADHLANDHRGKLYSHIPPYMMHWQWRKRNLVFELGVWRADIMCFQEVDRFQELQDDLKPLGYSGVYKMRTGNHTDGCAVFWRSSRFKLVYRDCIEFNNFDLRDNVAQICVLESLHQTSKGNNAALPTSAPGFHRVVICNIHVLYNPKRGEIKLGQVRMLLDKARAVSKLGNDAPIVLCGDYNFTPKSPLYNFISEQKLDLSEVSRYKLSGQASVEIGPPRSINPIYRGPQAPNFVQQTPMVQGKDSETKLNDLTSNSQNQNNLETSVDDDQSMKNVSHPQLSNNQDIFDNSCINALHEKDDDGNDAQESKETKQSTVDLPKLESGSALHIQGGGSKDDLSTPHGEGDLSTKSGDGIQICTPAVSSHPLNSEVLLSDAIEITLLGKLGHLPSNPDPGVEQDKASAQDTSNLSGESSVDLEVHNSLESLSLDEAISESENATENDSTSSSALHNTGVGSKSFTSDPPTETLSASPDRIGTVGVEQSSYRPSLWTPMELEVATGHRECTILEHPLNLKSTYTEVEDSIGARDSNGEPLATSYNRCFFGTVDYIWRSEGLQTVRVLAPLPKQAMQWTSGFPTRKWGSDHIALATELVFTKSSDQS